jgi:hypothetical protein
MLEDSLKTIARQILALDEATLIQLLPKYRKRMENFTPTREWEESVIIYFLINGYRIKNTQFNERLKVLLSEQKAKGQSDGVAEEWAGAKPDLRLIK